MFFWIGTAKGDGSGGRVGHPKGSRAGPDGGSRGAKLPLSPEAPVF